MALALKDRVKETTIVVGTGTATLLGSSIGFQPFSVVGNGNTTYYCISDQFGSNWEVGIGTYSSSGNTLARTTVLASSNAGALVTFTAGIKDVFVTYPAEKGVWLDASGNAIGLGTPAAFVGTNITGTASGLTAGNVTTNANLTGAITSVGNATSLGSFTSANLAAALTNETGSGSAVFSDNATLLNPTYTGTLTGSTGILNIGSGQVYKDASGNVGIGTSSPAAKLELSTYGNSTIRMGNSADATYHVDLASVYANESFVLSGGNGYKLIAAEGYNVPNILKFYTANTERMRIDSSGNVGIGCTPNVNFGTKIQLGSYQGIGASAVYQNLGYYPVGGVYNWRYPLGTTGWLSGSIAIAGGSAYYFQIFGAPACAGAVDSIASSQGSLYYIDSSFNHVWQRSGSAESMRIDSSGNVGIGTSNPSQKLEVYSVSATVSATWQGGTDFIKLQAGGVGTGYSEQAISFQEAGTNIGAKIGVKNRANGAYDIIFANRDNSSTISTLTEKMRIDTSGNLLVGTTAQFGSGKVCVSFDGTVYNGVALKTTNAALNSNFVTFYNSATTNCGGISQNGTTTVNYITSSDYRLKENIAPMIGALDKIANLNPVTYIWKDTDNEVGEGFIAHELQAICPLAVSGEKDAVNEDGSIKAQGIDPSKLVALLTASIKELKAIIDTQQEQINSLLGK